MTWNADLFSDNVKTLMVEFEKFNGPHGSA